MSDALSSSARDRRVDSAIVGWFEAVEAGTPPDRKEFLAQHAEVALELAEFLADHENFRRHADGLPNPMTEQASAEWRPSGRLGDFELIRVVGRGGMAIVYEAVQRSLGRRVALKVLPAGSLDVTAVERFRREAAIAAALQHPHIVPIHATGEDQGTHYYAMELISGRALDASLRERSAPPPSAEECRKIAADLADVAAALHVAHEHGIIHRDIKPSNLLYSADGRLMVGDFGLARWAEHSRLTQSGECIGSPAYMSPEQANAAGQSLDRRTDIYSLGITLYEAITLRHPYNASTRAEVLAQILCTDPVTPRRINGQIPADLETICLNAIEKEPGRRYATAERMAADLRRCAAGESIAARPVGAIRRAVRSIRRRSLWTAAIVSVSAVACTSFFAHETRRSRQELAARQLQSALDDALLAALGGELSVAEQRINTAEELGASPGNVALLRGQTAYFRGDYEIAVNALQQATELLPQELAARSMYAAACVAAGSWQEYEKSLALVEQLTPITPEDHLFRGLAETYLDPPRGLRSLDQAVQLRNWPLSRLIRAEVRSRLAQDRGLPEDAIAAVDDAAFALEMLPNHVAALLVSLDANLVAADIFARTGQSSPQRQSLEQAEQDAVALRRFLRLPLVAVKLSHYLLAIDQPAAAHECLEQAARAAPDEPILAYNLALALYRDGDVDSALRTLDGCSRPTGNADWLRLWLLMETAPRDQVVVAYQQLKQRESTGLEALFRPCLMLLLGDRQAAVEESRDMQMRAGIVPRFRTSFYRQLLFFNSGEATAVDLLLAAENSQWDLSESHFFLGLTRLSDGDRVGARAEFQLCRDINCHGTQAWDWSSVVLSRLAANPSWPKWIP